ncbi:kinase-like domain-containing protein [Clohesyomyces aquaticus]|uniref:non-specific serine/threonine protein kinase n=1 Tax=Clohesyomyces aquaticus TaxID=1231657 RepID=A0A1Y1YMJ8_9PLEO|nr:kinase-like domain-containing protein [Clohesyomyces aquaticus]
MSEPSDTTNGSGEYDDLYEALETAIIFGDGRHMEFKAGVSIPLVSRRELGSGAEGTVDEIEIEASAVYARKVWKGLDGKKRARRLKEVELLKRLESHPHIVQIVQTYSRGCEMAIIMSPVAESDLKEIPKEGSISQIILKQAFGCLVTGLAFVHKANIIHGDIKPNNVLLYQRQFLLTDFGCARDITGRSESMTEATMRGTVGYCAPEVIRRDKRGRSADVFSLACVLMEIWSVLKGNAHRGDNPTSFLSLNPYFTRLEDSGEGSQSLRMWIATMAEKYDEPLDKVWLNSCSKMLRKEPKKRPTLNVLLSELDSRNSQDSLKHALFCTACLEGRESVKPATTTLSSLSQNIPQPERMHATRPDPITVSKQIAEPEHTTKLGNNTKLDHNASIRVPGAETPFALCAASTVKSAFPIDRGSGEDTSSQVKSSCDSDLHTHGDDLSHLLDPPSGEGKAPETSDISTQVSPVLFHGIEYGSAGQGAYNSSRSLH